MDPLKPFRRIWRNILVYIIYPLFNNGTSKIHLSSRPDELGIHFKPSLGYLRPLWRYGRRGNNHTDQVRLFFFMQNITRLEKRGIPGAFAELGVFKGSSARILRELAPARDLYLLDTFSGFSDADADADLSVSAGGDYACDLPEVKAFVGESPNIHYCPGLFPGTASMIPDQARFALVHLDCDLYEPIKSALKFFYPRLNAGGMLIVHDYAGTAWPGVRQAVDEFFADKPEHPVVIPDRSGTAVLMKSG